MTIADDGDSAGLGAAVHKVAAEKGLLVCVDYDGTLAPIVDDPSQAVPLPDAAAVLARLAATAGTTVAVVSGRSRADLAALSGFADPIVLVGSHGSELDDSFDVTGAQRQLLRRLVAEVTEIAAGVPGASVEAKPASVAVHVRRCSRPDASRVISNVTAGPASLPGVQATPGKEVIELAVIDTDKGRALDILRESFAASRVMFIGDDVTDEKGFARLRDGDVGIKVGPGESKATYRLADPRDVLALLDQLARDRAA
ncbi:MAG: trehalose-phosphatase [Candidatus Nanopelagicales bacterium]|nr:trehalose-phosphatase [Candidatus Nanopelagicales bacterium]